MFRHACALVLFVCLAPSASAQEQTPQLFAGNTAPIAIVTPALSADAPPVQSPALVPRQTIVPPARRPPALLPMYVGFAALQAADFHSTSRAIDSGAGREANPVMAGVVGNRAAFLAVKAGSSAGLIWASEKIWRKNRAAAVVFMAVANGVMAGVVAHNYGVNSK
jgi:hypothetical protein